MFTDIILIIVDYLLRINTSIIITTIIITASVYKKFMLSSKNFIINVVNVQEKELAVAASKLAECQKTIASLGRQLNSLATLEDFLTESEKPLELNNEGSRIIPIDIW